MANMKMDEKHWKMHKRCMGWKMLVLGLLVLANSYWNVVSWANFIGIVLAAAGIFKLSCRCGK